jgi:hypothetical protein
VTAEGRCIQAKANGKGFDGARHLFVGSRPFHDFPALGDRPEKGPAFDPGCIQLRNSL